jgi:site-specific DNA recombinase
MPLSKKIRKILRVLSYGRVSTVEQAFEEDGSRKVDGSPEAQKNRCKDHIKYLERRHKFKYKHVNHISDEGFSGKNTNRPGFQELLDQIGSGNVDVIVATELSRLSRSVVDFLKFVAHCEKSQVDIVIIGLDLDTSTPTGRLILVILIALAQFEREMTSSRVKENALIRLIKDGKINGAAEILGLDRDPNLRGHFVSNEEELIRLEKILRLLLKYSSKKKLLDDAKKFGLAGKKGRKLTSHMLDIIIQNVKWRYRGLWYINKGNEAADPEYLSEAEKFKTIKLPHGPLIDVKLLDQVQDKINDTWVKKKRAGKNNYIYLLTNVLYHEDGTSFSGELGKGRNQDYRYYRNYCHNVRIRCDELSKVIVARVKRYFSDNELFESMVKDAIKKRQAGLPKIDREIKSILKKLSDLEINEKELSGQLITRKDKAGEMFFGWLEKQVESIVRERGLLESQLSECEIYKENILEKAGLVDLRKTVKQFVKNFERLNGVEQRELIEKIVKRVIVKKNNEIDLELFGEKPPVVRRDAGSYREVNGVADGARTHDNQNHNLALYQLNYGHRRC